MNNYSDYAWLIVAGVLVATEIATGTFYLLMLAISAAITWFAERLGASFLIQTIVFLCASIILSHLTHRYRRKLHLTEHDNIANNLDSGGLVTVTNWQGGIGNTHYRGANWQVVLQNHDTNAIDGIYRIVRLEGNRLLVETIDNHS